MKKVLFAVMFFACLGIASTASAQYDDYGNPTYYNDNTPDPCPTYESCTLQGSKWWRDFNWGSNPDRACPSMGSTCSSCLDHCECEYKKNENKCNNGITCLHIAKAEKDACDATCIEHYC